MRIWVELTGLDGTVDRREVLTASRDPERMDVSGFGLSLEEGKAVLSGLQMELTQFQVDQTSALDRPCLGCGSLRGIHDYRHRSVHSLFGVCRIRRPRFQACRCGTRMGTACDRTARLLACVATPELQHVQAELGARLSFREAARILDTFLPASRPHNHRTVSNRLAKVADRIGTWDIACPHRMSRAGAAPLSVFIDGAYIRAAPGYQTRHFEILIGRVEGAGRRPRHFAASPHVATGKHEIVRAALKAQGWMPGHAVTVFSDGDPSLRSAVMSATRDSVTHILDWFHLSMRLHHIEQVWQAIEDLQDELRFSISLVAYDITRLRHLLWNGYVRESTTAVDNMLYHLASLLDLHTPAINAKFKRAFKLVAELLSYLRQNGSSIISYCQRYWSGIAISSSRAESTVNALVNARMNKRRQMRWSPIGAHRVLQARAAAIDGRLTKGSLNLAA